jgi:acyl-CoA synthetase (AMP-forming)/AMP-acid ligase II
MTRTAAGAGYIHIVGRKREMIISGDTKIFPTEDEQVMNGHPLVANSAVVGVPEPEWGESVRAFVALKPDTQLLTKNSGVLPPVAVAVQGAEILTSSTSCRATAA